ncbi:MAG TPA: MBL fold metallo-hydrolase, partial [Flavobacterium sp.]|nr:MBL fold metallo-hydrolase [Flavobacterium sp.]
MTIFGWRTVTLALTLFTLLSCFLVLSSLPDNKFHFTVLDVGQGDAILITTPDNIQVLVDAGPGTNILKPLAEEMSYWDKKIDVLLLTHPDADHLDGFIPVLERYNVSLVLHTGVTKDSGTYAKFRELIETKNISNQAVFAGDVVHLGQETTLQILWPTPQSLEGSAINETAIAARLSYKDYNFLLTGDIGFPSEAKMVAMIKPEYLQAEVLKVGHHGSRHSSSTLFLQQVQPQVATISAAADNRYGHPTPDALGRLEAVGAKILRTDQHG